MIVTSKRIVSCTFIITAACFVCLGIMKLACIRDKRELGIDSARDSNHLALSSRNDIHVDLKEITENYKLQASENRNATIASAPQRIPVPDYPIRTKKLKHTTAFFMSPMTAEEEDMMYTILKVFTSILEKAKITYFLYAGTLIGSLRHHGRIPWDDDIDILVRYDQMKLLKIVLSKTDLNYSLHVPANTKLIGKWKFYNNMYDDNIGIHFLEKKNYTWPYIDIFFYKHFNKTHAQNCYDMDIFYPIETIYPLQRRPFEDLMLPSPCNPMGFLSYDYNMTLTRTKLHAKCQSLEWNHMFEYYVPDAQIWEMPCRKLYKTHPFVFLNSKDQKYSRVVTETLRIGDSVIQELQITEGTC